MGDTAAASRREWLGSRVRLRPVAEGDLGPLLAWGNDPALRDDALGFPFPVTEGMTREWLDRNQSGKDSSRVVMIIEDMSDDAAIGLVQLTRIDWTARTAELGMKIGDPARRGRGLGSEALQLIREYAFTTLNLRRLWLQVAAFNLPAIRLYEKQGFQREGCLREQVFRQGRYHDLILMGLLRQPPAAP